MLTKTLELVRRPEKCSRCPRLSLELLQGPWNPPPPHACRPLPVGSERGGGGGTPAQAWCLGLGLSGEQICPKCREALAGSCSDPRRSAGWCVGWIPSAERSLL